MKYKIGDYVLPIGETRPVEIVKAHEHQVSKFKVRNFYVAKDGKIYEESEIVGTQLVFTDLAKTGEA